MKRVEGEIRLSASDLAGHLGCRHRTNMDLEVARGERKAPPVYPDPIAEVLRERGFEHEAAYVASLGEGAVRLEGQGAEATAEAMRSGAPTIVQATLQVGRWMGRVDVLRRVDVATGLGAWGYEVIDTKLSVEAKAATVLQLCLYTELVAQVQGRRPEAFHVVAPAVEGFHVETFRVAEYEAYYRHVKRRLEGWSGGETYPDPVEACDMCRWWQVCDQRRRADDSVWLVAGVRRVQQKELAAGGVTTLEGLARVTPLPRLARGSAESLARTQLQAQMQLEGRVQGRPVHTLLPVEAGRGLCRLPEPSEGDVFFDIEGDRMGVAEGREFLFGLAWSDGAGGLQYRGWWATTEAEERRAFEAVMDVIGERAERWPDMHVYHYAPYEPAALKRMMGRHGTREDALDVLLRGGRFVDLFGVVSQAMRASVESYSIKRLEVFYGYERAADLRDASSCVRAVRVAIGMGSADAIDARVRDLVEAYNREDCESACALRDWLERLRREAIAGGAVIPRPARADGAPSEELSADRQAVQALMRALLGGVPEEVNARDAEQQARWVLAQMLEYHRREHKVHWWKHFELAAMSADDAMDEREALAGLEHLGTVKTSKQGIPTDRYRFPEQDHELGAGDDVLAGEAGDGFGEIVAIDRAARTVDIKKTKKTAGLHPPVVFHHPYVRPGEKVDSIRRLGEAVARQGFRRDGAHAAAGALLLRTAPAAELGARDGEGPSEVARRVAVELDGDVLPIQGPPGTGKTYTAARMIVALVRAGKKVGVTAMSHKVIRKVLDEVVAAGAEAGVAVVCMHKDKAREVSGGVVVTSSNEEVAEALADGSVQVAGGTAWLWSREEMAGSVDVLFVDEAGQMSLADTLAVAQAGRSMVLVGDPRQLEQPQQGSHPDGTEVSALEHLFGGSDTVPAGRGIFLGETWRMAPAISGFTSELFYEERLRALAGLERQALVGATPFAGAGLWFVPVSHEGNQNASDEEVAAVVRVVEGLLGGVEWVDRQETRRGLRGEDILVVAPYNAHVDRLEPAVGARGVRVGTVDKFQGQEAPVVIYSTATSTPEEAPRGMEFLYSLNRLNVATSRARCACILVASPRLFEPECKTPRQMKLANAFCRYLELARTVRP
ncbi:MAG TPA: TM0106 family RecB-like putative nuclease [Kofleriaceae bacterium]|nr:TM0106 family RecB-like putative nuclease [Kofleriaceae bacterium]